MSLSGIQLLYREITEDLVSGNNWDIIGKLRFINQKMFS